MPRHIAAVNLSLCILAMFGTSTVADEVIFDLSEARVDQTSADQVPATSPDSPESASPNSESEPATLGEGIGMWRPSVPQFDLPSRSFSLFRSPASYGWSYEERCAPTPWKPRGNGIPRRTSCYRMDYRPYELKSDSSKHGPAFYMRYELYPCPECHAHDRHLQRYYGSQCPQCQ